MVTFLKAKEQSWLQKVEIDLAKILMSTVRGNKSCGVRPQVVISP